MATTTVPEKKSDLSPAAVKAIKDQAQPAETKSDKFIRLANRRVNKLIKQTKFVVNLADVRNYEYSETQAKKIVQRVQALADSVAKAFAGERSNGDGWSL